MSHEYEKGVGFRFNCNGVGCRKNYEACAPEDSFQTVWAEAKTEGWVNLCDYNKGNISEWKHYCAKCNKRLEEF